MQKIIKEIKICRNCTLHKSTINTVPGEGPFPCDIVICGEAPGATESETGRPFCGRSGNLLTKMLESIGLKREDVFILNIVKCRPPDNRKPTPEEMSACLPFLHKQLEIIQPKVILTLGSTATEGILGPGVGITKRRASIAGVQKFNNIDVVPTFHPSYLLRNPAAKVEAAKDLAYLKRYICPGNQK